MVAVAVTTLYFSEPQCGCTDQALLGLVAVRSDPLLVPPSHSPSQGQGAKEAGSRTLQHSHRNTVRQSILKKVPPTGPK